MREKGIRTMNLGNLNAAETLLLHFTGGGPRIDPKAPHALRGTPPRKHFPRTVLDGNRAPLPRRFVRALDFRFDRVRLAKFAGFRP